MPKFIRNKDLETIYKASHKAEDAIEEWFMSDQEIKPSDEVVKVIRTIAEFIGSVQGLERASKEI